MSAPVAEIDAAAFRIQYVDDSEIIGTVGIAMRDQMTQETVTSLLGTRWPENVDKLIFRGSILTLQRNAMVAAMRGDWLLFIDDDMTWEPDAIIRLIERWQELEANGVKADILGALCFRRVYPYQPTLYAQQQPGVGPYAFIESWTEGDFVEVDATGMAFALVSKACFERLGGEMPDYNDRANEKRHPDFFKWMGALGEDLRFCQDVRLAGGRIFVDTSIQIGHVGVQVVGYRDYLKAMSERSMEKLQERLVVEAETGLPTMRPLEAQERLRGLGGR